MSRSLLRSPGVDSAEARAFVAFAAAHPIFDPGLPITIARAPGRLDLMGGIADYSGSLVLQWPLREATMVAVQEPSTGGFQATSVDSESGEARSCNINVADLFPDGSPLSYEAARAWFRARPSSAWSAYVFGALLVLARERGLRPPGGLRVLIWSDVPEGKGVSSSAALEVATLQALTSVLGLALEPRELALIAQSVENDVVGAACGVMDQMTSSCGVADHLLALFCQPAELLGMLPLPEHLDVWGIDSGIRHAVSGSDYTSVRVAAFMGARILSARAGLRATPLGTPGKVLIEDPRWGGHLANIMPSELEGGDLGVLPDSMSGSAFLEEFGGITDAVTAVDPSRDYRVRACTVHPVHENFRVRAFAELLQGAPSDRRGLLLGELMFQSHASYSTCGLGSEATDRLVALVRAAGPARGFFGAKITGGGSGGTVAVLGRRGADIDEIARACEVETGNRPRVFSGSSAGAAAFGTILLGPLP